MAHKFFKIVAITQDEYFDKTQDEWLCSQSVSPEDDGVYVAIDTDEYELQVDMDTLSYLTPTKEGKNND